MVLKTKILNIKLGIWNYFGILVKFRTFYFADEKWRLNAYDRNDNLAIDPDGLLCQSRDPKAWNGARCSHGVFGSGINLLIFCIYNCFEQDFI